jgi:hypothetical protein
MDICFHTHRRLDSALVAETEMLHHKNNNMYTNIQHVHFVYIFIFLIFNIIKIFFK